MTLGLFWLRRILRMASGKYLLNRIYIIPTYRCNQECRYCGLKCYNGFYPRWDKEISYPTWKPILSMLDEVSEIVITGGEPTLYVNFVALVNYLSPRHLVYIDTNFTNHILWSDLIPSDNVFFVVSLHKTKGFSSLIFNHNVERARLMKFHYKVYELGKTKKIQTQDELYHECTLSSKLIIIPDGSIHFTQFKAFKYMEEHRE